jgi:hypothetical protein
MEILRFEGVDHAHCVVRRFAARSTPPAARSPKDLDTGNSSLDFGEEVIKVVSGSPGVSQYYTPSHLARRQAAASRRQNRKATRGSSTAADLDMCLSTQLARPDRARQGS